MGWGVGRYGAERMKRKCTWRGRGKGREGGREIERQKLWAVIVKLLFLSSGCEQRFLSK